MVDTQSTETKSKPTSSKIIFFAGLAVLIAIVGVGSGYLMAKKTGGSLSSMITGAGKEIGSSDTKVFKDNAMGIIEKGGLNGEGTHKLIREGGPSQTAYLISSVVELDQFEGKKVRVWGETMQSQKVPWLMDVGRVKTLE